MRFPPRFYVVRMRYIKHMERRIFELIINDWQTRPLRTAIPVSWIRLSPRSGSEWIYEHSGRNDIRLISVVVPNRKWSPTLNFGAGHIWFFFHGVVPWSGAYQLFVELTLLRSVWSGRHLGYVSEVTQANYPCILCIPYQGSRMWLLEGKDWVPATVTEFKGGEITFRTEYDKVRYDIIS